MGNGPSEDDVRRAERAAQEAKETAKVMAPFVERNRLNPLLLKQTLDKFAPGNDAQGDGIFDQRWLSADTFYNNTVDYVDLDKRPAYKAALDAAFPKKATP